MSAHMLCNIIGWTSLIASWGIQYFKFKDDKNKYFWGAILSSFSVGVFTAMFILS